ncbi:MAG: MerR family transcriptional regulator [Sphingobacteriales bacterium]|nr:MerR family transcriptional regulator [Sphingobacteriales bacterium]
MKNEQNTLILCFRKKTKVSYSIKDLERLTGIKAHTIRIWEKRYHILNPDRKPTNIRQYQDEDLKKILNVAILNQSGIKISKIAGNSDKKIAEMVEALKVSSQAHQIRINSLVKAMIDLNEDDFLKVLNDSSLQYGFETTVIELIFPFLDKVGVLWQTGNILPVHEHFISNLIRQKLIVAIDNIVLDKSKIKGTILMFLPEGEYHEFGLLFYYYLSKKHNFNVFYMGQSSPYNDILSVSEKIKPDRIITAFVSSFHDLNPQRYIQKLASDFQQAKIGVSGYFAGTISGNLPSNVFLLKSVSDLIQFFE